MTERYGSGIKRIVDACGKHGGVRFEIENHGTWFKAVLSKVDGEKKTDEIKLPEKLPEKLGEKRRLIIDRMKTMPFVTIFELMGELGISHTAVKNNIAWLKEHGYIRRVGGDKGGYWEVLGK